MFFRVSFLSPDNDKRQCVDVAGDSDESAAKTFFASHKNAFAVKAKCMKGKIANQGIDLSSAVISADGVEVL